MDSGFLGVIKMNYLLLISILSFPSAYAVTFKQAAKSLEKHEVIEAIEHESFAIKEQGNIEGSWGDPRLMLAAKNFPKDSLKDDETPMTGIELSLSQKIALTTKYGNMEDSYKSLARAMHLSAKDKVKSLQVMLWNFVIERKRVLAEKSIFKENLKWLEKTLKVSKKLYTNGKISQPALLELQVRKSKIESLISEREFDLLQLDSLKRYLLPSEMSINEITDIPWNLLNKKSSKQKDYKELALKEKLNASDKTLGAARQNYIPDLTFSIGYTKRSDIDDTGDFVSASISFPIPTSSTKYSVHDKATQMKFSAQKNLRNYQLDKLRESEVLRYEIAKISKTLSILTTESVRYATNSRVITTKSYGLGNSTYLELLTSEFNLQDILLEEARLISRRDMKKAQLRLLLGEQLYE